MNGIFEQFLEENNLEITEKKKEIDRSSPEYREWRQAVLTRDNNTCQCCGGDKYIETHHIFNYKEYPSLRCDVNNGISLCKWCHGKYHSYHGKDATPRSLMEFYKRFECENIRTDNLNENINNGHISKVPSSKNSNRDPILDFQKFIDVLYSDKHEQDFEEQFTMDNMVQDLIIFRGYEDSNKLRYAVLYYLKELTEANILGYDGGNQYFWLEQGREPWARQMLNRIPPSLYNIICALVELYEEQGTSIDSIQIILRLLGDNPGENTDWYFEKVWEHLSILKDSNRVYVDSQTLTHDILYFPREICCGINMEYKDYTETCGDYVMRFVDKNDELLPNTPHIEGVPVNG